MSQTFLDIVRQKEPEEIAAAVEAQPDLVRSRDAQGISALLWSIYAGRPRVRDFLLAHLHEQGVQLDVFEAAACGDCDRLKVLLREDAMRVLSVAGDGWTPLHLAAAFADARTVRMLLEHGAHVHQRSHNPLKSQPLHSCLALSKSPEIVQALIDCGADVNATQAGGYTALHQAAVAGSEKLVTLLLQAGADPKLRCDQGKTAADYARERGYAELARLLEQVTAENPSR
ncbi:MAG: ankyrin repeat domain-containing protein [Acidobacteriaceae bacterium]